LNHEDTKDTEREKRGDPGSRLPALLPSLAPAFYPAVFILLAAGCAGRTAPTLPAAAEAPAAAAARPALAAAPSAPAGSQITAEGAGPLRLGGPADALRHLPNLDVRQIRQKRAGAAVPALAITRFGQPVALADVQNGTIARVQLFTPEYATPEGARVGMAARKLNGIYGAGTLGVEDGNLYATFPKWPAFRFYFRTSTKFATTPGLAWDQVLTRNPSVQSIAVTGAAPVAAPPPAAQ
jgi:hypothetical protein